jgi:hypothetical protein
MSVRDLVDGMNTRNHRGGQQPEHVTIGSKGVLCGEGSLGTHVARTVASKCPDHLGKGVD